MSSASRQQLRMQGDGTVDTKKRGAGRRSPAPLEPVKRYLLEDEAAPPDPLDAADPLPPPLVLDDAPPPLVLVPPLLVPELDDEDLLAPPLPGVTTVVSLRSHAASANALNAASNT